MIFDSMNTKIKSQIKDAWQQVKSAKKFWEEKKQLTENVVQKQNELRQKIADIQKKTASVLSDRPVIAERYVRGGITEAEFEAMFPDGAAYHRKVQAFNDMLRTLDKELKRCSSGQQTAKYSLNDAYAKAWNLIARGELLEILPGLLRSYAAYSAGKADSGTGYSETGFTIEMLTEEFKQYQQEIYKIQDKMRKEHTR